MRLASAAFIRASCDRQGWVQDIGGLRSEYVHRLRRLEAGNARPKHLVAERDLEIEVVKEVAAEDW